MSTAEQHAATEMSAVGQSPKSRAVVTTTYVSRQHAWQFILWAAVAIAAAVSLGQGDWYTRELSDYNGNFVTYYYGLRMRVQCNQSAVAAPAGSTQNFPCYGNGVAFQQTYASIALADVTPDELKAAKHLIAAGDIIIVVLAFAVVFGILAALINLQYAFRYENEVFDAATEARHHRGAQVIGFLAFVSELLAIIFWITIFPYSYARSVENGQSGLINNPGFIAYLTFGTGLGFQIGGVIVALLALVSGHYRYGQATPLPGSRV